MEPEKKEQATEQKSASVFSELVKVLYAPRKTFEQIKANPKPVGTIIVMALFLIANLGFIYVFISKTNLEQTFPASDQKLDEWTQNATLWVPTAGETINPNFVDFINGSYYGNNSLEFSTADSTDISMLLQNIGPVNCSGANGYAGLSFRTMQKSPETVPSEALIYLYSSPLDYFYLNLTDSYVNTTTNVWNNITIQLNNSSWLVNGTSPSWQSITGLKLGFSYPQASNITVLLDGLFFRGVYKSLLETSATAYIVNYASSSILRFIIEWGLFGLIIYIIARGLGAQTFMKIILILLGFAFMTLFVQAAINAIALATLPKLYYPVEYFAGVPAEAEIASNVILAQVGLVTEVTSYVSIIIYVWTVVLCTFAIRALTEFSWMKSSIISAAAFLTSLMFVSLLGL